MNTRICQRHITKILFDGEVPAMTELLHQTIGSKRKVFFFRLSSRDHEGNTRFVNQNRIRFIEKRGGSKDDELHPRDVAQAGRADNQTRSRSELHR